MVEYRQKRSAQQDELRKKKNLNQSQSDKQPQSNVERQRRYVEALRTPGNEEQLEYHRERWKERQRERRQMKRNTNVKGIARQNLETFNESTVLSHNVGCMDLSCHECGALMFAQEKSIPVQGNASKRAFPFVVHMVLLNCLHLMIPLKS